jgi:nucleoside-diphosphate-sugar epimerase
MKKILITGASGCIGHYISETLIQQTNHELYLLVRTPEKLKIDCSVRPGVHIIQGDMVQIEKYNELIKNIDVAVLTATAWGGTKAVFDVNVNKTIQLMKMLEAGKCEQIIYFSTASILGRDNQLLPQAGQLGTDYIRSKYECYQQFSRLPLAKMVTTLYPTLVLGGDENKPFSHLTSGLPQVVKWIDLIRFLKADGSFHFIHGKDIAGVVNHLIDHPPSEGESRKLVLGTEPVTVNQAVETACEYLGKEIKFRLDLSPALANVIIKFFRIQMAAWDRFCLEYRHFTYQNPVNPGTFGLPVYCQTFTDLLKVSGVPQKS